MKKSFAFLFAILFWAFLGQAQMYTLSNPDQLKMIDFSIVGNSKSTHYHYPLIFKAKNNSPKEVMLKIDNGLMLIAIDSTYQNFVVTAEEILTMVPGETVEKEIYAMCTESTDAAPGDGIPYVVGPLADSNLLALTRKIEKDEIWGFEAQTAVWAMCRNFDLYDIAGYDTTLTRQLAAFVAEFTDQEMPPPPGEGDYLRNYYTPATAYKVTITGEFTYNLYEERSIIIALVNIDNIVVRELYNSPKEKPGGYNQTYSFDATVYTEDYYFVKMIDNGEVVLSIKINTPKPGRG
ncbi:MAG: hypothetical protein WC271_12475 [Bacteroidales bacterium]|nr:hypothetical protein [Bacteroidales bacterium]MDD3130944.1 hypothetical protein [Bacteroidales bacterium]NLO52541.1 hypothetical protein [Bacteroidales bacterium]